MKKFTILFAVMALMALAALPAAAAPADPAALTASAGTVAGWLAVQVPSISIDLSLIFQYASDIVSMMMPIVGVGAGISFGFALVAYIIRLFRQIF